MLKQLVFSHLIISTYMPFQEFATNYWAQNGAPRRKLNVGLPLYGRSFTLSDESKSGINAPAVDGGGKAGKYTREKGYLAYYEAMKLSFLRTSSNPPEK